MVGNTQISTASVDWNRWRLALALAGTVVFALLRPIAVNAQVADNTFRAYSLLYVTPEAVEPRISEFLKDEHPDAEVVVDSQKKRLLVRGGAEAQSIAQKLLDRLDRPPAVPILPPPERVASAMELKAFRLPPNSEDWVEQLRRHYAPIDGVRIAIDSRTAQLLVFAPERVHAEIENALSHPVAAATPHTPPARTDVPAPSRSEQYVPNIAEPSPNRSNAEFERGFDQKSRNPLAPIRGGASDAVRGDGDHMLRLERLSTDTLQSRLEAILRRPLSVVYQPNSEIVRFTLEATPGERVVVEANRQTGEVRLTGEASLAVNWARVIRSMDSQPNQGQVTQLISTQNVPRAQVRQVATTLTTHGFDSHASGTTPPERKLVAMLFQNEAADDGAVTDPVLGNGAPGDDGPNVGDSAAEQPDGFEPDTRAPQDAATGLIGPVQIEFVEGLDILVVRGDERDVQRVMEIIGQIETLTKTTEPTVEVYDLANVESQAMALLVREVYEQVLAARQGDVSITPLVKPNALLLIGRPENVETVIELIKKLDQPVDANQEFEVFPLKFASAVEAKSVVDEFFGAALADAGQTQTQTPGQTQVQAGASSGLAARVQVTADYRTNSLIVRARPRDMAEVRALVARLDTDKIDAVDEVRVFSLRNALASELAPVLSDAIAAQSGGAATQTFGGQFGGNQAGGTGQGGSQQGQRSAMLRLMTIDAAGRKSLESGILTDVRISADARSNTLVVTAPAKSMDLIAALIQQLDQAPTAEAQLKVFSIANGDAFAMVEMLETLFGDSEQQQQQQGPALGGVGGGGESLVRLRFSVDERTNSIIAAGTEADLAVVEAVLLRLDDSDVRERKSVIYRLRNAPAQDVADALNNWLRSEREVQQIAVDATSSFQQIESEVIVVPELVSNSLIVSTTPRYFEEVRALIEQIDERPPMVMIQVLIAEVALGDTDEFGVELGLQDSLLFDRSLIGNLETIQTVTSTTTPGGAVTTVEDTTVLAATLTPGFDFANPNIGLGNAGSDASLASAGKVAAQGLTSLGVGRVNSELGFGGFVLSAGSESVNVLLRALQESRRIEVLSRPQIMAIDNQFAVIQVGQRVPIITSSSVNTTGGQVNTTSLEDVGLILRVQPRVSPDELVVMEIEAEKSEVGPESEGIPVSISPSGEVVRSPRINRTFARSVVHAMSGQTVVLSGLITKRTEDVHRRVPLVSEIPLLGQLFRYDRVNERRTELLIIMTPRIVRDEIDADLIKQVESARMNWVLCDVIQLNGPSGLRSRRDEWTDRDTRAIYPTYVPSEGEVIPAPMNTDGAIDGERVIPPLNGASNVDPQENESAATSQSGASEAAYAAPTPLPPTGTR